MNAAKMLRTARHRANLSQRQLATRAGVPHSTVARIELGEIDPRLSTMRRLLRECAFDLEVQARLGMGVDKTLIEEMLARSPQERLEAAVAGARVLQQLRSAKRV